MKRTIFILVFASFVKIYRFSQNLILPSQSSQQINYQGTLNQDQNTGSSEGVVFEGSIYSKTGLCLDNYNNYFILNGYEILGFSDCNLLNGDKTQQWKFLSNGQIVQNVTGLCISYYAPWDYLMITDCNNTDSLQFWTYNTTKDSQWMYFMNVGYTRKRWGEQQCMVQAVAPLKPDLPYIFIGDEAHADLTNCDSYNETQLFKFSPTPTIVFEGPIYSIISDLCLDIWDGREKLAFIKCNGNKKQHWIFISTGHIMQKSSDQCIQYDRNFMVLRDCHINYSEQIWNYERNYEMNKNQQLQFINQGQTKEKGVSQCMLQDEEFAKLHDCNPSQHNQFFTFVPPPPLPPSPPPLNQGPLQCKQYYHCLHIVDNNDGHEMLGLTDCVQTNEYQQWQFLQNGQIKQQISGMCISYYPDWKNLMITTCNASDLLQFWTNEACQDNFCTYKNQGYSQLQGQDYCMQGGYSHFVSSLFISYYAGLDECDYSDESQLFTFSPIPSPPHFSPPFPHDDGPGIVLIIIIIIILVLIIFASILIIFIRAVTARRQQQQGVTQNIELQEQLLERGIQDSLISDTIG